MNRFVCENASGICLAAGRRRQAEAGFTLLETMVALALCGLIIGALGTATHLYWKYRSLTRGQVNSTHLIRGLTEDLSEDLRSVVPQLELAAAAHSQDELAAKDTFAADGFSQNSAFANHDRHSPPQTVAFIGTSKFVAVLTEHASSRFDGSQRSGNLPEPQYVVWWINDGSSQRIIVQTDSNAAHPLEISASGIPKGMIRTTITADFNRISGKSVIDSQLISSDVESMGLMFFDGQRWTSDWPGRGPQEIPQLIEITLTLTGAVQNPASFVVAIPQGAGR